MPTDRTDAPALRRTMSIDALGVQIRIDGSALTDTAWEAVRARWQDAAIEPTVQADPAATVTAHGTVPQRTMLTGLSTDVTLAAIEARAGRLLMLHAAGLAMTNGHVVALVGPSGRGKTTASRVLGAEFGYVTDETVAVDPEGTVLPYRKPLSLIESDRLEKVQRSPSELGLRPLPRSPLRLAALVLLERTNHERSPTLAPVGFDEGITALAAQASYLGRMLAPLHTIAAHIEAVGGVYRLTYSDARTLVPLLRELGEREPREPRMIRAPIASIVSSTPPARADASVPRWYRAEGLDEIELPDGRLVVLAQVGLLSTRVVVLDGIGPTLWRNTEQPAPLETLVHATVAVHGQPPGADAAAQVTASLADLTEARLLTRV